MKGAKFDYILAFVVLFLTFFGLFMILEASSYVAFRDFGDKFHYVKEQSIWAIAGIVGMFFFTFFDYRKLYYFSLPLLIVAIIMLLLVFVPGVGISLLGARRWIDARFFLIQPAEFVKLSLAVYLSAWLSNKEKGRIIPFILLLGLVGGLVVLEPDVGTAVIILSEAVAIFFLSGGNLFFLAVSAPIAFLAGLILIKIEPYRAERLSSFINVSKSLQSSSYHIKQILIALGAGGFTGVGVGNSLQKYAYLPETTTDSIFAILVEELGFAGALFLVGLYVVLVIRGFKISAGAKDKFGKLLAGGIVTFLCVQAIMNLSAQTILIPITGVPLPFISYGGSALIVDLVSIGILLNISKQGVLR